MKNSLIKLLPSNFASKLKNNISMQKVIKNTSWLVYEQFFRLIVTFFIGIWLARYLGPVNYGVLSYSISLIAIIGSFVSLGLSGLVVREIIKNPKEVNLILGTTFYTRIFSGIIGFLLTILIIFNLRPENHITQYVVLIIASILVFQAFETVDLFHQATLKSKYTVYCKNATLILTSLFKVLLILSQANLIWFAFATAIEACILAFFYIIAVKKQKFKILEMKFDFSWFKYLLSNSWPLIFSSIAAVIYLKIDQVMLGEIVGDMSVGIYAAASKLSEAWFSISVAIATSIFPVLVSSKLISKEKYNKQLQNAYDLMLVFATCLAIPISFSAEFIISILFGKGYEESGIILSIHIWTALFVYLRAVLSKWLINEGLLKFSLLSHGLGAVINILLNFLLIPSYGGIGAAIATVVSYAVSTYLFCFISEKTRPAGIMMTKSFLLPIRLMIKVIKK